jgi:uncharacterized membrane protein
VLSHLADAPPGVAEFNVIDHQRGRPLVLMLAVCALVIVAFGRLRGFTALIGLVVSFAALLWFVIPAILDGSSPLLVAIVGSAAIMFAVLYLTHGVNVHTSVAVLGTLASLVVTGVLGAGFTAGTKLTGFGTEEAFFLSVMGTNVDMRGLLLAGIIIGALGVLDDVTVTQAAAVWELSAANPSANRRELVSAGLRIGRTHVASVVNTLVLAYAGAALPILLIFAIQDLPGRAVLSTESVAMEVVRGLVGSLGIIAAVPLTTALAAMAVADRSRDLVASQD